MFNVNNVVSILLFNSFLLSIANISTKASEDEFGFKPGFLSREPKKAVKRPTITENTDLTQGTVTPAEPSKALVKIESQPSFNFPKVIERFQYDDYTAENQRIMWDDPSLYGPEGRQQVCSLVKTGFTEMGEYLDHLLSPEKELSEPACLSHPLFYKFLEFVYTFNWLAWAQGIPTPDTLNGPVNKLPYAMQALVNRVIHTRFRYMNTLSFETKDEFQKRFLMPGSNDDHGEFVFASEFGKMNSSILKVVEFEHFQFKYFSQMGTHQKTYHLYLLDNDSGPMHRTAVSLPSHPTIGAYQPPYNEFTHNVEDNDGFYKGFLLDKKGRLMETPGMLITKEWNFSKDYVVFAYGKHPFFDQMCFLELLTIKEEENLPTSPLLDMVGGMEALNRDKILFLPHPHAEKESEIHHLHAEFLLPYAHLLYLEAAQLDTPTEQITRLIEKLEANIVEDSLQKDDPALVQECALEIASEQINELLKQEDPTLNQTVKKKSKTIFESYVKPEKPSRYWKKKSQQKAKKEAVKQVKQETSQTVTPAIIRERRKMKTLERIREKYIKEVSEKPHFKTSEANDILSKMREELSRIGIEDTKKEQIRGSHVGKEIISKETGASTHLGKANRPQRTGYQQGTLKKIINTQVEDVISIAFKKLSM